MKSLLVFLASGILGVSQLASAAARECQPLPDTQAMAGDVLVALASQAGDEQLLQVNFKESTYCYVDLDMSELDEHSSAALHISESLDEIAIEASIDGEAAWLRVDYSFADAMVLQRSISERLGLTDAEFLGDNSLLEASDYFVEFVYSLELGGFEIEDVEVSIPRLDVPYDHYTGRSPKPEATDPDAKYLTVGSIGKELLEDTLLIFDAASMRVYASEAR